MTATYHLPDVEYAQYIATGIIVVDGEPSVEHQAMRLMMKAATDYESSSRFDDNFPLVAPEWWRKLTEPCSRKLCVNGRLITEHAAIDVGPCPNCVGGCQVVTLTATCPGSGGVSYCAQGNSFSRRSGQLLGRCLHCFGSAKITLGRFTIRLLPIVEHGTEWLLVDVVASGLMNGKPLTRLWRWNGNASQYGVDAWGFGEDFTLAHLPQSGQWAIQFEAVK